MNYVTCLQDCVTLLYINLFIFKRKSPFKTKQQSRRLRFERASTKFINMKKIVFYVFHVILEKRRCLDSTIFLLLISCFFSCKKGNNIPPNNNEMKATVVVSTASTININAAGTKARMGCSLFGGTYVEGTNEANAAVYITTNSINFSCITSPGIYSFACQYRPNVADPNTPIYSNIGPNPGSITFSTVNDHYMQGTFNAVCRCITPGNCISNVDSVIVTGSFKGDY